MQVSRAFNKSPEAFHPGEDVRKTTASLIHAVPLGGENRSLNSTAIWGYNYSGADHRENSFTVESNLQLNRLAFYALYENIEKSARELLLSQCEEHAIFRIQALTIGSNYSVWRHWNTNFSAGAQSSFYGADVELDPVYGRNPLSLEVYLRVSPVSDDNE